MIFRCLPLSTLLVLLIVFQAPAGLSTGLQAQQFRAFTGDLVGLPEFTTRFTYDDWVQTPDSVIGQLVFPALDFLPRDTKQNFPGVTRPDRFAFLLDSKLTIDTAGCYVFSLASDDGSRLWLNDALIIDNDTPHQWKVVRDTQQLTPGVFPVRVWYFNAYIPLMGLALKCKYLGPEANCAPTQLTLSASALFAFGRSDLQAAASPSLDSLAAQLATFPSGKVTITGHTDNRGDEAFNDRLSLRRAEAVLAYLESNLPAPVLGQLEFLTVGAGQREPVTDNDTPEGQAANRRVVVLVER